MANLARIKHFCHLHFPLLSAWNMIARGVRSTYKHEDRNVYLSHGGDRKKEPEELMTS